MVGASSFRFPLFNGMVMPLLMRFLVRVYLLFLVASGLVGGHR